MHYVDLNYTRKLLLWSNKIESITFFINISKKIIYYTTCYSIVLNAHTLDLNRVTYHIILSAFKAYSTDKKGTAKNGSSGAASWTGVTAFLILSKSSLDCLSFECSAAGFSLCHSVTQLSGILYCMWDPFAQVEAKSAPGPTDSDCKLLRSMALNATVYNVSFF